jgi:hypothetical protein
MDKQTEPKLLPCPFCGGEEVRFRGNGAIWNGMGYSEPVSISIIHHCLLIEGQPSRAIERVGKDRDSAIAAWNMRHSPWQPIETAPKDGTRIIGWSWQYGASETSSKTYSQGSIGYEQGLTDRWWQWYEPQSGCLSRWLPTHWMPLPPTPKDAK